jgi:peroxiredoxin
MTQIKKIRLSLGALFLYYALFGVALLFLPSSQFPLIGLDSTTAAWPLRLAAVMVCAFGVGILLPMQSPLKHWGITALITAGQLVMPLSTVLLIKAGDLPARVGVPMASVDLLFLFAALLAVKWTIDLHASSQLTPDKSSTGGVDSSMIVPLLEVVPNGTSRSINELSHEGPVLMLLLRHLGCTFCRETLSKLSENRQALEAHYRSIVIVSMSPVEEMIPLRKDYQLEDVLLLSDPERTFYRALQIPVGSFSQTLGWKTLKRGLFSGLLFRHGIGQVRADPFQLPGSAAIERGAVVWSKPAADASEPLSTGGVCSL